MTTKLEFASGSPDSQAEVLSFMSLVLNMCMALSSLRLPLSPAASTLHSSPRPAGHSLQNRPTRTWRKEMDKPVTETRGDSEKYNKGGKNRIQTMLNPVNIQSALDWEGISTHRVVKDG